jgi:hypothetical protein
MHDSDYFDGLCPCNNYPCKRSVEAQTRLFAYDRLRGRVWKTYMKYHKEYPQADFITEICQMIEENK